MTQPTILITGATGNTGLAVASTLSTLNTTNPTHPILSTHRILALTRSLNSPAAQQLASLPGITVLEKSWPEITSDWLRSHNVTRAFVASQALPDQFAVESTFHVACLNAGVQHVVRISSTAANVRPDCRAFYSRSHWALEAMLGTPEFAGLGWTSLQANVFSTMYLISAVEFVKGYRKTGSQGTLSLMAAEETPVGVVDPYDVGVFAASLLSAEDIGVHSGKKYVLNGPVDVTGQEIVRMVEERIHTKVERVVYKDLSFLEGLLKAAAPESRDSMTSLNVALSLKYFAETYWEGKCTVSTTSKEVLETAPAKRTPAEVFNTMLEG